MSDEPIPGLRDFMANSALSMLATEYWSKQHSSMVAHRAYQIADAMLIERKGENTDEADRQG